MPKILITGCSSGFGLAIAQTFVTAGWEVVATMRTPQTDLMPHSEKLTILALDVTNADSITEAVKAAGPIDALVNNAGVGMLNVLEGAEMPKIRELFETNVFGAMAMTKAVLPQMRIRQSGVIVNVSSSVTLKSLPALSVYSASKAALNAFTESLALEAALFGSACETCSAGFGADDRVRQKCRRTYGNGYPRAIQRIRPRLPDNVALRHRVHDAGGRGRGRLARGDGA